MASLGNIKVLTINGKEYDIKDALSRILIYKGKNEEGKFTKEEAQKALQDAMGDTSVDDFIDALASLNTKIEAKANKSSAVTNVAWSNNVGVTKTINGTTSTAITKAQLLAATNGLRTAKANDSTATDGFTTPADVATEIAAAKLGVAKFKGTTQNGESWPGKVDDDSYTTGDYWLVGGTESYEIVKGVTVEPGDMIYAIKDGSGTPNPATFKTNFTVVQANIDPTIYSKLEDESGYAGTHDFTEATVNVKAPTAESNAATKKYVDDEIAAITGGAGGLMHTGSSTENSNEDVYGTKTFKKGGITGPSTDFSYIKQSNGTNLQSVLDGKYGYTIVNQSLTNVVVGKQSLSGVNFNTLLSNFKNNKLLTILKLNISTTASANIDTNSRINTRTIEILLLPNNITSDPTGFYGSAVVVDQQSHTYDWSSTKSFTSNTSFSIEVQCVSESSEIIVSRNASREELDNSIISHYSDEVLTINYGIDNYLPDLQI